MRGRTAITVMLALGVLQTGCSPPQPNRTPERIETVRAEVVEIRETRDQRIEEIIGTVRSRSRAVLASKIGGRVTRMAAVPGDRVEVGAVLVELDDTEWVARREQAEAHLAQAEQDSRRVGELFRQAAVTRAEQDAMDARLRAARASVAEAAALLENVRIRAPFEGVLTRRLAELGDLALPGRPLVEVEDSRQLRLEVSAPASLMGRIHLGMEIEADLGLGVGTVRGRVGEIEPSADPLSRTFQVRLDLPAGTEARVGGFGRLRLPLEARPMVKVPVRAVTSIGQLERVWVVADGVVRLRLIRLGRQVGTEFEVLAGLDPGERIALSTGEPLRDGQRVEPP